MAKHICLTGLDESVVIVDANRIISCEHKDEYNEKDFDAAINAWLNRFRDEPDLPHVKRKDFATGKKLTLIKLPNKIEIEVRECPTDIFKLIES